MQATILKPTSIIYLVLERNVLFIYLIEQKVYLFIQCPFIFNITFIPPLPKIVSFCFNCGLWAEFLSKNMCIFNRDIRKGVWLYINEEKLGQSYTFS